MIELVGWVPCVILSGDETRIRIAGHPLPETVLAALSNRPGDNCFKPLSDIIDHPFIAAGHYGLRHIRNDGDAAVLDVESRHVGFAPIPDDAMAVAPSNANPIYPWRPTMREMSLLYALVDEGRELALTW